MNNTLACNSYEDNDQCTHLDSSYGKSNVSGEDYETSIDAENNNILPSNSDEDNEQSTNPDSAFVEFDISRGEEYESF